MTDVVVLPLECEEKSVPIIIIWYTTAFFSKRLDSNGGYENVICVVVRIWFCWLPPGRNVEGRHHT